MAQKVNCQVVPVDLGVLDFWVRQGENCRVRNGTGRHFSGGPAMTRAPMHPGNRDWDFIGPGGQKTRGVHPPNRGDGGLETPPPPVPCQCFAGEGTRASWPDRAQGLSEEGFPAKVRAIRQAICRNAPDPGTRFQCCKP